MSEPSAIDAASRRLALALDALAAAVERRHEADRGEQTLDADRSKLTADLDEQLGKVRSLESANREIARRLDAAMENIRLVLESQD